MKRILLLKYCKNCIAGGALLGAAALANSVLAAESSATVLESLKTADGIYIHEKVRLQAVADLERNLRGARLSKENLEALNAQLFEVGLKADDHGGVTLLSQAEYDRELALKRQEKEQDLQILMTKNFQTYCAHFKLQML